MTEINVDVNMTLQVSAAEWKAAVKSNGDEANAAMGLAELYLQGEEILTHNGDRAWICAVDKASKI